MSSLMPFPPSHPVPQTHPAQHHVMMINAFHSLPPHLMMPPPPPVVPQPPRLFTSSKSSTAHPKGVLSKRTATTTTTPAPAARLSKSILEPPSHYATTHELISQPIRLIRSPALDPQQHSFGVNLKAETTSRLVEPPPMMTTSTGGVSTTTPPPPTTNPHVMTTTERSTPATTGTTATTTSSSSTGNDTPQTLNPATPTSLTSGTTTIHPEQEHGSIILKESRTTSAPLDTDHQDLSDSIVLKAPAVAAATPTPLATTTATVENPLQQQLPLPPQQQPRQPRQPRRRRVHFTVMMVMDAVKQNERWNNRHVVVLPNTQGDVPISEPTVKSEDDHVKMTMDIEQKMQEEVDTETQLVGETVKREDCGETDAANEEEEIIIKTDSHTMDLRRGDEVKSEENTGPESCLAMDTGKNLSDVKMEDCGDGATLPAFPHKPQEKPTLLQPGDIILKVGGVDLAGMTFAEACRVFHEKSVEVKIAKENGDIATEIQVELVVARAKKLPTTKPVTAIPVKPETKKGTALGSSSVPPRPLLQSGMLAVPKSSAHFSFPELAVVADCVIQAIHDQVPNRLLGQRLSRSLLEKNTDIFRKVDGLKECILKPRSSDMIVDQWNQLCMGIRANLADRARAAWTETLRLEDDNEEGASSRMGMSSPLFSSDAERTALRQLPRPAKGCRCQRRDHEYLHDVRCDLYRDICRLVPADELKVLQYNPESTSSSNKSKSSSADKDLKTVEAAYKDRMVKMLNVAELEAAEARFVAKMEQVQIEQMHKAVFAPTLATMVLSAIMELQKEFPFDKATSNTPDQEEDLDDEALTLSGKRKQSSGVSSSPKKKRTKVNGVERLNFKYLARMVQLIGNTWGHIYREPSHEDYAW